MRHSVVVLDVDASQKIRYVHWNLASGAIVAYPFWQVLRLKIESTSRVHQAEGLQCTDSPLS